MYWIKFGKPHFWHENSKTMMKPKCNSINGFTLVDTHSVLKPKTGCVWLLLDKLCNNSHFQFRINTTWATCTAAAQAQAPLEHSSETFLPIFFFFGIDSISNHFTFVRRIRFYGSHVMLIQFSLTHTYV